MNTSILAISGISIKQDSFGRFCLNDLHKAAGGERRHEPTNWTALQQTKDLIAELLAEKSTTGIPVVKQNQSVDYDTGIPVSSFLPLEIVKGRGKVQGTFVVKELVYAYATWISAKFFLTVIRAYDAIVSKPAYALRELPTPKYLTTAMKKHINRRVAWLVKNQVGATFPALGKLIQDTFNVNKREFVPYEKYRELCALLGCEPDPKALEGELLQPAKLEYQPPAGMALVDVAELETLRRKKPFQIFKADNGLMQYTAEDSDNNKFAMIPMDKWEDLSQAGSFTNDEKLVQVKSGQVIKMEDFIEQIFQDPCHPYIIAKRDVMTSIRTLFNSLL